MDMKQYIRDIQCLRVDQEIEIMLDRIIDEIKRNKPSSIDIEINGIERVGFAVGLNKAIEIIEKYKEIVKE